LTSLAWADHRVSPSGAAYRPDIDGLRAIAVLAVVGFHVGILWLPGGYVGVDIFFVISGYLIGSIIISEVRGGRFSLARFYVRRIRRIVPALVVMMLCVLAAAYVLLLPVELANHAASAISVALSVSNIYFLNHTGYFDAPAATTPLLHTWSLSVEEQFYAVFPLVVLLLHRFLPRRLEAAVILLMLVSFAFSAVAVATDPERAFYLAPLRAWELLLGTFLAIRPWTWISRAWIRDVMAAIGLGLIAFAIRKFTFETPFPGVAALAPCVGAALVIAAGQSGPSLVGRLLSLRPVVFFGLISYSLYLWHWPILVFQRTDSILLSHASPRTTQAVVIAVSIAVATLSWKFVEQPFRKHRPTQRNARVYAGGFAALALVIAPAVVMVWSNGLADRFNPQANKYAAYLDYTQAHFREGKCFIVSPYTFADFDRQGCLGQDQSRKNYLLLGDSEAAHLWYGMSNLLSDAHVLQATVAGCAPRLDYPASAGSCGALMNYMFNDYLPRHHVDRLLIAARWMDRELPYLQAVLAMAASRGIPVTLFGPMVEYDLPLPRLLADAAQTNMQRFPEQHVVDQRSLDGQIAALAAQYNDEYISFYGLLCAQGLCATLAADGSPLQFDQNHLTKGGSLFVVKRAIDAGDLS
jgi:peptidoglycan/LPS O-acetylase OafA/YrhL